MWTGLCTGLRHDWEPSLLENPLKDTMRRAPWGKRNNEAGGRNFLGQLRGGDYLTRSRETWRTTWGRVFNTGGARREKRRRVGSLTRGQDKKG